MPVTKKKTRPEPKAYRLDRQARTVLYARISIEDRKRLNRIAEARNVTIQTLTDEAMALLFAHHRSRPK